MRSFSLSKIPKPKDLIPIKPKLESALAIEIGCGVGFHALKYAAANPHVTLFAIERTKERFSKFSRRVTNHARLLNLVPIHGDAIAWIAHGVVKESVDKYFLLYPNPCPKEKQANLRWHNMPFFGYLIETMKYGGALTLSSNEAFYIEEALDRISNHWGLRLEERRTIPQNENPRTHFEKKYLLRGDRCETLVFRKL